MAVPGSDFSDKNINEQLVSRIGQSGNESLSEPLPTLVANEADDSSEKISHQQPSDHQSPQLPSLIHNREHYKSFQDCELMIEDLINNAQSMDSVIQLKSSLSSLSINSDAHNGHAQNDGDHDHSNELTINQLYQQNHDLKSDLKNMIDKHNQYLDLSKKAFIQLNIILNGIRSQKTLPTDDLWSLIMENSGQESLPNDLIIHSSKDGCPTKNAILLHNIDSKDTFLNLGANSVSIDNPKVPLNDKEISHENINNIKKSLTRSSSAVQQHFNSNNDTDSVVNNSSPKIVTTNLEEFRLGKGTNKSLVYHASVTNLNRTSRTGGGSATSLMSPSTINDNANGVAGGAFGSYEISQQLIDKQIGAIERSYGGSIARQAAYTIQRAYRSYRLRKRFTSLAMQAISQKKMLSNKNKLFESEGQSVKPFNTVLQSHGSVNHSQPNEFVSINSCDDSDNQTTTDIENSHSKGSTSSSVAGHARKTINVVSNSSSSSYTAAGMSRYGSSSAIVPESYNILPVNTGDVVNRMDTLQVIGGEDDQRTMSLSPIDRAAMQNRFSRKLSANFALEDLRLQGNAGIQQQQHQQHHHHQPQQQQYHQQQHKSSQQRSMSIHPQHSVGAGNMTSVSNISTVAPTSSGHLSSNRDFYTIPRQGSPPIIIPVAYESVYNTISSTNMYHHNNNNNNSSRSLIGHDLVIPKKTPSFSSTSSTGSGSTGSLHAGWSNSSKHQLHSNTLPNPERNPQRTSRSNSRQFVGQISQDKKLHLSSLNNNSTGNLNVSTNNNNPTMTISRPIPLTINSSQVTFAPNVSEVSSNHSEPINSAEDACRKRRYRVGLNLFNKAHSERGIQFLIDNGFIDRYDSIDQQAKCVAQFLHTRKGMSRQMIGEYISENKEFNKIVLKHFCLVIDFAGSIIDDALRYFQSFFRFPGEAQKIERLVEAFADRYKECNPSDVLSRDSVFILSFAIIMLNTDLHKPNNIRNRMTPEQWLNNLKGVFIEGDLSSKFLMDIYKRIKRQELATGTDHVTQVAKVQSTIVGRDVPNFALPHRRLVCYCSLYEIRDLNRYQKAGQHPRDIFLFNDLLLITKATNRARHGATAEYQYRSSTPLDGLQVLVFSTAFYPNGVRITRRVDNKLIACFNARNDLDQQRFVDDLQEAINEMDEMEQLRIQNSNSMVQISNNNNIHHRATTIEPVQHFSSVNENSRRSIYHTAV